MAHDVITVMVVDDHPIWREGVARDLTERGLDVVATAADADAAVRIAHATRPQVVLMDLNLGDSTGVTAIEGILAKQPATRILVLSASGEHADVLEAVKAGATGYLLKSAGAEELLAAVRRTAEGFPVFTPWPRRAGARRVPQARRWPGGRAGRARRPGADRPRDRGAAARREGPDGASRSGSGSSLSHRTVESHVQNTLRKLQLHNRAQLVRYAIEQGLADD